MINTKIISLDQIIKSNISFLIRGTSLSKKYLNRKKSKERGSKVISKKDGDNTTATKENKSLFPIDGITSLIDTILMRKPKDKDDSASTGQENNSSKTKGNHSVVISLNHDESILTISNLKTTKEKGKNKNLFAKKNKERIQDYLECTLDQTRLEESDYIIKKGNLTIPLHKSKKYSITVNDEKIA